MPHVLDDIIANRDAIKQQARACGLHEEVKLFGSVVRHQETADSDIDFLVSVREDADAFGFLEFQEQMQTMLGRKCDIVFERGLFPPLREQILKEAITL